MSFSLFLQQNNQARRYLLYWDILSIQYLKNVVQNTICDIYGVLETLSRPAESLKTGTIRVLCFRFGEDAPCLKNC